MKIFRTIQGQIELKIRNIVPKNDKIAYLVEEIELEFEKLNPS